MSKKTEQKYDSFGNRMKSYEMPSTSRVVFKGLPIVARLDGKNFSKFTKGLKRPFDDRLIDLMTHVTSELVDRFHATCGFTQSDEITLVWFIDSDSVGDYPFSGRVHKFDSLLAATASVIFNKMMSSMLPEKQDSTPVFDCRTFAVPSKIEAANAILWRQQDCFKNSITQAASHYFSHKMLQNKNGLEKIKMMAGLGVVFDDLPSRFRYGTFVRRVKRLSRLTDEQLSKIPEDKLPDNPATFMCLRTVLEIESFKLKDQPNMIDTIFNAADIVKGD